MRVPQTIEVVKTAMRHGLCHIWVVFICQDQGEEGKEEILPQVYAPYAERGGETYEVLEKEPSTGQGSWLLALVHVEQHGPPENLEPRVATMVYVSR